MLVHIIVVLSFLVPTCLFSSLLSQDLWPLSKTVDLNLKQTSYLDNSCIYIFNLLQSMMHRD